MGGTVQAYLQLMRMKNVLLASITVPLGAQFAVGDSWLSDQLLEVISQILAVIFFIGAGNTMNDIKDIDIDREAHPERPLASGAISISSANKFAKLLWLMSITCVALGAYSLYGNDKSIIELVLIYVIAVTLMMTYDHGPTLKNTGLIGNISISIIPKISLTKLIDVSVKISVMSNIVSSILKSGLSVPYKLIASS